MSFGAPLLLLLLPVPVVGLAIWVLAMRRGVARAALLSRIRPARPPYLPALFVAAAVALGIIAAAQPRWGTDPVELEREGVDVMFVLDVSRGMAAQDVQPSRFDAVRNAIIATLDTFEGDRAGLVIFGGDASLRSPLTGDLAAARAILRTLEPGSIFVTAGTDIAAGLDLARETLINSVAADGDALIVLLSDGEQLDANDPVAAATRIGVAGFDLLVVGVGTAEGATVPVFDRRQGEAVELVDDDGQPVVTRLDEASLLAIAQAANGRYLGADPEGLPGAVRGRVGALERALIEARTTEVPIERFQWFAAAALALLVLAWFGERLTAALSRARASLPATGMLALMLVLLAACAEESYQLNRDGMDAFERGDYAEAARIFREAERAAPDDYQVSLNHAAALFAAGDYSRAATAARRALESSRPGIRAEAYSAIGHSAFAADDLPAALDAFRAALRENPLPEYRHNYEVVLRLLDPPDDGDDDQPGGENGEGPGEPGDNGDPNGDPGEEPVEPGDNGEPGPGDEGAPSQTVGEVEDAISEIDQAIDELQPPDGRPLTALEARELLRLLAERARLAALREALSGSTIDPSDY